MARLLSNQNPERVNLRAGAPIDDPDTPEVEVGKVGAGVIYDMGSILGIAPYPIEDRRMTDQRYIEDNGSLIENSIWDQASDIAIQAGEQGKDAFWRYFGGRLFRHPIGSNGQLERSDLEANIEEIVKPTTDKVFYEYRFITAIPIAEVRQTYLGRLANFNYAYQYWDTNKKGIVPELDGFGINFESGHSDVSYLINRQTVEVPGFRLARGGNNVFIGGETFPGAIVTVVPSTFNRPLGNTAQYPDFSYLRWTILEFADRSEFEARLTSYFATLKSALQSYLDSPQWEQDKADSAHYLKSNPRSGQAGESALIDGENVVESVVAQWQTKIAEFESTPIDQRFSSFRNSSETAFYSLNLVEPEAIPEIRFDGDVLYVSKYSRQYAEVQPQLQRAGAFDVKVRAYSFGAKDIQGSLLTGSPGRLAALDFDLPAQAVDWDVKTVGDTRHIVASDVQENLYYNGNKIANAKDLRLSIGFNENVTVNLNTAIAGQPTILVCVSTLYSRAAIGEVSLGAVGAIDHEFQVTAIDILGNALTLPSTILTPLTQGAFNAFRERQLETRAIATAFAQPNRPLQSQVIDATPNVGARPISSHNVLARLIGQTSTRLTEAAESARADGSPGFVFREESENVVEVELTGIDSLFLLNPTWHFIHDNFTYVAQEWRSEGDITIASFLVV